VPSVERRVAQPGDRICSNCGEPNDATRKFCRRCGNSLVEAGIVAEKPVPWYRRIFRRKPRQPTQVAAGDRPGRAGRGKAGHPRLHEAAHAGRRALGLLVAVGIFGYVGVPSVRSSSTRPRPAACPGSWTGSRASSTATDDRSAGVGDPRRQQPGRGPSSAEAVRRRHHSDWRADGKTPSVTATFPEKVDVLSVYVHSGVAGEPFVDFRRPETIEFSFPDGTSKTVTLQDVHDPQLFELKASGVDEVTIKVLSTVGPADAPMAISEIEFFKKGSALAPQPS
jgi:hypothetical protein